jgi:hypothetical protein
MATLVDLVVPAPPAGGGPQTFLLTLESGVAGGKPGINFIAMPFAGPWYAYRSDGTTKVLFDPLRGGPTTNEVKTAGDMVLAINVAAPGNVVSTFGKWDNRPAEQRDAGVLIVGRDPYVEPARTDLEAITLTLKQGEGYQVYITPVGGITLPVTLMIKNTP